MSGERLMDDSIEAIRRRHETSVVWAEGEVTIRVSDALWRAKKDIGLLLDILSAPSPVREPDPEYMCPNCVTPWKCNGPHILPVREPEGLDVERLAKALVETDEDAQDLLDEGLGEKLGASFYEDAMPRARLIAAAYNATPERPADEVDG